MLTHIICGSTFHPEDETDEALWNPSLTTPRRWRRGGRDSKNPYSTRGLDKFSALLADLEEKRQQIYSQVGSQDISFVRFAYSNSNDCVPIVVKVKDRKQENGKDGDLLNKHYSADQAVDDKSPVAASGEEFKRSDLETSNNTRKKIAYSWKIRVGDWRQPSYYFPAVIIFILLLLTVSGRSVAILCTCLGWYLVPPVKGGSSDAKRPTKKKEYLRRKSDKMMASDKSSSSPKANNIRTVNVSSPGQHGHRKSW